MSFMHAAVVCLTLLHIIIHVTQLYILRVWCYHCDQRSNRHISVKALQHVSAICMLQPAKHAKDINVLLY